MKRVLMQSPCARRIACSIWSVSLLALAGCSGGVGGGDGKAALAESEVAAIKSTSKSAAGFRDAVRRKALQQEGFTVPEKTTKSSKSKVNSR
jgi:hypothetical protein